MGGRPRISRIRVLGAEDFEQRLNVEGVEGPIRRKRLRVMSNLKNIK
jgi:hypothetical protein